MKTVFLADIHGNLEALLSTVNSLKRNNIDKVIFLGDIVGYGADPNECIRIAKEISDIVIAGNHDWACAGKDTIESFNPIAKETAQWTRKVLTDQNRDFLLSLSLKEKTNDTVYVHATPYFPESWQYIRTTTAAKHCFDSFSQQFCFIGHSHVPAIFILNNNGSISEKSGEISTSKKSRYIINCGSIGQPRDEIPLAAYGIYDSEKEIYQLVRVEYDIKKAQKKIIEAGLPPYLAKRLEMGR
jgi:diadenosine tetraphosphatase ApaH/serine/threonine PP2A family protein phosphatase